MILSSHLFLGLPFGLLVKGFHLSIFLVVLVSGILYMWQNQLSLWALNDYILHPENILSSKNHTFPKFITSRPKRPTCLYLTSTRFIHVVITDCRKLNSKALWVATNTTTFIPGEPVMLFRGAVGEPENIAH